MKKKTNKPESTFDLLMQDPKQKALFEKEYKELLISEMLLAALENDEHSVRKFAKEADVSPTIVQKLIPDNQQPMLLTTFTKIVDELGYYISIEAKRKF